MRKLSAAILRLLGWRVTITIPDYPKSIVCVAPHTSNWDFVLGELAYTSVGRKAGFLMKDTWFFWPLGCFFRAIGGIAVPRRRRGARSVTEVVVEKFKRKPHNCHNSRRNAQPHIGLAHRLPAHGTRRKGADCARRD